MIDAVLFDIGDTLLQFDTSRPRQLIAAGVHPVHKNLVENGHRPPPFDRYEKEVWRRVVRAFVWSRVTRREVDLLGAIERAHRRYAIAVPRDQLATMMGGVGSALRGFIKTDPDSVPVSRQLRESGLRLGIVSNVIFPAQGVDDVLRAEGLLEYFQTRVYSSTVRYRKPHPEIFRLALREMGVGAARALYVGDSLNNDVRGASRVGMKTVWLSPGCAEPTGRIRPDHSIRRLSELPAIVQADRENE